MVGAGSVVTRGVHPYQLVVGNPARHLGWICACGVRLPSAPGTQRCTACASSYRVAADACERIA
jgi:UDP-2-acetamido-3-amino-2,3-dideoxy-glucuronate N-acetyltransferase